MDNPPKLTSQPSEEAYRGRRANGSESDDSPWREVLDENTGRYYYFNTQTKQSTWTKPADIARGPRRGLRKKSNVRDRFLNAVKKKPAAKKKKRPSLAMFNNHYSDSGIGMGVTGIAKKLSSAASTSRNNALFEAALKRLDAATISNGPANVADILNEISDLDRTGDEKDIRKVYDRAVDLEHFKCAEIIGRHIGIRDSLVRRSSLEDKKYAKRFSARQEEMETALKLQQCLEEEGKDLEELMRAVHAGDALCRKYKISQMGTILSRLSAMLERSSRRR